MALLVGLGLTASAGAAYLAVARGPIIYQTDSAFGSVSVRENGRGVRSLYFGEGRARQGAAIPDQPRHLEVAYMRVATIGLALPSKIERVLFVGLGVGAMPMYTRAVLPEVQIDVVEIDPVVVDVAEQFFSFTPDPRMRVHVAEGRAFVENATGTSYDLIVLDAYSDHGIPDHLTTREFLDAVRRRLATDGVVVSNLWASSSLYGSMLATFAEVFGDLALLRVGGGVQRIVVTSNDGRPPDKAAMVRAAESLGQRNELGFDLPSLVRRGYTATPRSADPVLIDDDYR